MSQDQAQQVPHQPSGSCGADVASPTGLSSIGRRPDFAVVGPDDGEGFDVEPRGPQSQHLSLDKGVGYFGVSADDVADFESTRIHGELSSFLDKS